ncbi:hypothetical protein N646_2435 [Vibrio alginolyticus NBRC 15630 = ATCC 17749]|uniref:Uncharacterized protein n=1 Tax=Vibrio alginolyticus (strain ATCC 17749 / DSM 2171 / NBRC 15630 / NCIMB 1903 / NCTC 12160 / XII-53) TaxID=1219076 RepID=A0A2I3CDT3_VIBAX|nr:hypothetical protein N646_2435 [Vibrio alginolyticus NBRC 15630 = ATCC 17749]
MTSSFDLELIKVTVILRNECDSESIARCAERKAQTQIEREPREMLKE